MAGKSVYKRYSERFRSLGSKPCFEVVFGLGLTWQQLTSAPVEVKSCALAGWEWESGMMSRYMEGLWSQTAWAQIQPLPLMSGNAVPNSTSFTRKSGLKCLRLWHMIKGWKIFDIISYNIPPDFLSSLVSLHSPHGSDFPKSSCPDDPGLLMLFPGSQSFSNSLTYPHTSLPTHTLPSPTNLTCSFLSWKSQPKSSLKHPCVCWVDVGTPCPVLLYPLHVLCFSDCKILLFLIF